MIRASRYVPAHSEQPATLTPAEQSLLSQAAQAASHLIAHRQGNHLTKNEETPIQNATASLIYSAAYAAIAAGIAGQVEADRTLARAFVSLPTLFRRAVVTNVFLTRSREEVAPEGETAFVDRTLEFTVEQKLKPRPKMAVTYGLSFGRKHVFEPDPDPESQLPPIDLRTNVTRATAIAQAHANFSATKAGIDRDRAVAQAIAHRDWVVAQPSSTFSSITPTEPQSWLGAVWSVVSSFVTSFVINFVIAFVLTAALIAGLVFLGFGGWAIFAIGMAILAQLVMTAFMLLRWLRRG